MKRKHIPLKVQLAAALLQICEPGSTRTLIEYEHSKQMTADQIISLFQLDHWPIRHADGGPDESWNLTWRWIGEHREKTKRDVKEMAKSKRIRIKGLKWMTPAELENMSDTKFNEMIATVVPVAKRKRKIPSRPFPKGRKFKR